MGTTTCIRSIRQLRIKWQLEPTQWSSNPMPMPLKTLRNQASTTPLPVFQRKLKLKLNRKRETVATVAVKETKAGAPAKRER